MNETASCRMSHDRILPDELLARYQLSPDARLSSGMEAEVYTYGSEAVLKVYARTTSLPDLLNLQAFYQALDRQAAPYALPDIYTVEQESGIVITIERRLTGTRLAEALPSLSKTQLDEIIQHYFTAALAVARIPPPPHLARYKLFDPAGLSAQADGDWHRFLARYLDHKLAQTIPYLSWDVSHLAEKVQALHSILAQPYVGDYQLIHGDFFPGNLLIDAAQQIVALLDFGMMTMVGDRMFDLATSWVFFDMYDDLKAGLRRRCLAMLLERLGEAARGKLYRYVLIYSLLSANTYSPTCADGHYQWCVDNLNQAQYWREVA